MIRCSQSLALWLIISTVIINDVSRAEACDCNSAHEDSWFISDQDTEIRGKNWERENTCEVGNTERNTECVLWVEKETPLFWFWIRQLCYETTGDVMRTNTHRLQL